MTPMSGQEPEFKCHSPGISAAGTSFEQGGVGTKKPLVDTELSRSSAMEWEHAPSTEHACARH